MGRALAEERAAVLRALRRGTVDDATAVVTVDRWEKALTRIWKVAADVAWDDAIRTVGENPKAFPQDFDASEHVQRRARDIAASHRLALYQALTVTKSVTVKGEQLRRVARSLYDRFRGRVARGAINEGLQAVAAVTHTATRVVARATGASIRKEWVTVGDNRVRPAHQAANGQQRRLDENFQVGGEALKHPRDPAGSASNVIGCRCWTEYRRVGGASTEQGAVTISGRGRSFDYPPDGIPDNGFAEIEDARRWFRARGVDLEVPDDYDLDSLKAVAKAYHKTNAQFPVLQTDLGAGPLGVTRIQTGRLAPYEVANHRAGTLTLKRDTLPSDGFIQRGSTVAVNRESMIVHEMAHSVEYCAGGWDKTGESRQLARFMRAARKSVWGDDHLTYGKITNDLSRYATEDVSEFFAEAFTAHNNQAVWESLTADARSRVSLFAELLNAKTRDRYGFDII